MFLWLLGWCQPVPLLHGLHFNTSTKPPPCLSPDGPRSLSLLVPQGGSVQHHAPGTLRCSRSSLWYEPATSCH